MLKKIYSALMSKKYFLLIIIQIMALLFSIEPGLAQAVTTLSTGAVVKALDEITAHGTRSGSDNTLVHIHPTPQSVHTLPAAVRSRNNFYGFKFDPDNKSQSSGVTPELGERIRLEQARAINNTFPSPIKWYPADLIQQGGYNGNTRGVVSLQQHNIYMNCSDDKCWGSRISGNIVAFENALNASNFITITNQYVGSNSSNRYPHAVGANADASISYFPKYKCPWSSNTKCLLDSEVQALVAAAAAKGGTGYGHIYHVFVPKGTDVCQDSSFSACYSPDNDSRFMFCAYHGSFNATINGANRHLLYSVEPFNGDGICQSAGMTNIDAQANVLSHELFEAITDPDPGFQWYTTLGNLGEIGDICAWKIYNVPLSSGKYQNIQLEYSNLSHACSSVP